ncbi:MAG: hypothetical protein LAO23_07425 [Acidobacteriia bacterium]|nr:hypothetical protein [Terriglobia bacterium]
MDPVYMLACGIVWQKTADPDAGWELVDGLESSDPCLRLLAWNLLVENGEQSMDFLESAVATGQVSPQVAGPLMAEILRSGEAGPIGGKTVQQHLGDVWVC